MQEKLNEIRQSVRARLDAAAGSAHIEDIISKLPKPVEDKESEGGDED